MTKNQEEFPYITYVTPVPTNKSVPRKWLTRYLQDDDWRWENLDHHLIWLSGDIGNGRSKRVKGMLRFRNSRHQLMFELACAECVMPAPSEEIEE